MTTHEPEVTSEVDLCTPDHARLAPQAKGWSRQPRHRANLGPPCGANKSWDYWAILAGDLVVSAVIADLEDLGLADVWWADLATAEAGGASIVSLGAQGFALPERPGTRPLHVEQDGLSLTVIDHGEPTLALAAMTELRASWTEPDGRPARLSVRVDRPAGHESLNVVVPWSDERFNFTSKHQARPATGDLVVGDRHRAIGGDAGDAWGVLDVGRGRWPAEITWNWGGGAGRVGDHVVGLQVGAKWTEGTGATENGLIVDGRLSKIGRELSWRYDWDRPLDRWEIDDPGGQLHAVLTPRYDKVTDIDFGDKGSAVHQVFGTWSGRLRTDDGQELAFDGLQGFAEEARQRW